MKIKEYILNVIVEGSNLKGEKGIQSALKCSLLLPVDVEVQGRKKLPFILSLSSLNYELNRDKTARK